MLNSNCKGQFQFGIQSNFSNITLNDFLQPKVKGNRKETYRIVKQTSKWKIKVNATIRK